MANNTAWTPNDEHTQPCAYVHCVMEGMGDMYGIAFQLGENLSKTWRSGEVIILATDGNQYSWTEEDWEVLVPDLWTKLQEGHKGSG